MEEEIFAEAHLKGIVRYLVLGIVLMVTIVFGIYFLVKYFNLRKVVIQVSDKRMFGFSKTRDGLLPPARTTPFRSRRSVRSASA